MEIFESGLLKMKSKMYEDKVVLVMNTGEIDHIRDKLQEILGPFESDTLDEILKKLKEKEE